MRRRNAINRIPLRCRRRRQPSSSKERPKSRSRFLRLGGGDRGGQGTADCFFLGTNRLRATSGGIASCEGSHLGCDKICQQVQCRLARRSVLLLSASRTEFVKTSGVLTEAATLRRSGGARFAQTNRNRVIDLRDRRCRSGILGDSVEGGRHRGDSDFPVKTGQQIVGVAGRRRLRKRRF
jgi:hypothetical protein